MFNPSFEKAWKYSLFMKNPKERAGFFSRLTFSWLDAFMKIGYRRSLEHNDLLPLLDDDKAKELTCKLEHTWSEEVRNSHIRHRKARLSRAMLKILPWNEYGLVGLALSLGIACRILQPLLLGLLLTVFLNPSTDSRFHLKYVYAFLLLCIVLVNALAFNQYHNKVQFMGMRWRAAALGLSFKKVLKLRQKDIAAISHEAVLSLVSNDVQCLNVIFQKAGHLIQAFVELITITALLWRLVGFQAVSGIIFLIFLLAYYIGTWDVCVSLRQQIRRWTDKRLQVIQNIVSNIRLIKMNTWEWLYEEKAQDMRSKEMLGIKQKSTILLTFAVFLHTSSTIVCFISLTTLIITGAEATTYEIFVTMALLVTLRQSTSPTFATAVNYLGEISTTLGRIQSFLELEESVFLEGSYSSSKRTRQSKDRSFLDLTDNDLGKYLSSEDVSKISSDIRSSKRHYEPRPFQALSGDGAECLESHVTFEQVTCHWKSGSKIFALNGINMKISVKELAFINGPAGCGKSSLLSAILGELPPTGGKISCCGKMAYVPQRPWVFMDSVRENILFGQPYNPFRYQAVLNSCKLQKEADKFPEGDMTVIGSHGVQLSEDLKARISLARAAYSDADIYLLDDPLCEVDGRVAEQIFEKCICGLLSKRLRILTSRQLQYVERADQILTMRAGEIINEVTAQVKGVKSTKVQRNTSKTVEFAEELEVPVNFGSRPAFFEEEEMVGPVPCWVYWRYFTVKTWVPIIMLLALLFFAIQGALIAPDIWIVRMTKRPAELNLSHTSWTIYSALVVGAFALSVFRSSAFYTIALRSSTELHKKMLKAILKAPVVFFDNNSTSSILNRFSKDISCMDEVLPRMFISATQTVLFGVSAVLVPILLNPVVAILTVPLLVAFVVCWRYYLLTSRQVRGLEMSNRPPVVSLFRETLKGLVLIRGNALQESFTEDFYRYQDAHSQAWCAAIMSASWVGIRLDFVCVIFVAVVLFGTIVCHVTAAVMAVSLIYSLQLVQDITHEGVQRCSDVENYMSAVERVHGCTEIESERGYEYQSQPPKQWPKTGTLSFNNVSLKYFREGPRVLKDVSFSVKSGEKLGITGASGSGKSAVIHALFLMSAYDGQILVDDVKMKHLNLQTARQSLSVITKDVILFMRTVRANVDPFEKHTDKDIWGALERVQLKAWVQGLPKQLYQDLSEVDLNPGNNECQLMSLARALLKESKILLIDEASSCVDYKTDRIIQETIRSHFQATTVITVPHRLSAIVDYDRVMVLDRGRIIELDKPEVLLKKEDGYFAHMYECRKST